MVFAGIPPSVTQWFSGFAQGVMDNGWIILFYLLIILVIYLNRKKFMFEAKIIAMYRAKWGIPLMERIGKKHAELVKMIALVGIGVGFVGMVAIVYYMLSGIYSALFVPSAPATFSLVIPGVKIPGSPIVVPFWYGIISLFIVVVIHEFCHGVVASAYKLKVQSTGIVFFGPLIGAFVEPDEKELQKRDDITQMSLFAAGPFSNIILAGILALLLIGVFNPLQADMVAFKGVSFDSIQDGYPAMNASVQANVRYSVVNGQPIRDSSEFITVLNCAKPGEAVTLATRNESHIILTTQNPSDPKKAYLGVIGINSEYDLKDDAAWYKIAFETLMIWNTLLQWIIILSLGIGLANLLPLGPVDGGRMIQLALMRVKGQDKGMRYWKTLSIVVGVIILFLIIVPILKATLFKSFF